MNSIESNNLKTNFSLSLALGSAATLSKFIFLPPEAKAAIKNTMFGKDYFVKNLKNCTEENIKNTGKKLDMDFVLKNVEKIYPDLQKTSKLALKSLVKTFAVASSGIFLAKTLMSFVEKQKVKSEE